MVNYLSYVQPKCTALHVVGAIAIGNNDSYDNSAEQTYKQNEENKKFLRRNAIREDLQIREGRVTGFATGRGTNFSFASAKPTIILDSEVKKIDPNAYQWLAKHEIGHIKKSDTFRKPCVIATATFATGYLVNLARPFIAPMTSHPVLRFGVEAAAQYLIYKVGQQIVGNKFSEQIELDADDFAIRNSSIEEKMGGIRQLKAMQLFQKVVYDLDDAPRMGYPSFSTRIKKIEASLRQEGLFPNDLVERDKITQLASLAINLSVEEEAKAFNISDDDKNQKIKELQEKLIRIHLV